MVHGRLGEGSGRRTPAAAAVKGRGCFGYIGGPLGPVDPFPMGRNRVGSRLLRPLVPSGGGGSPPKGGPEPVRGPSPLRWPPLKGVKSAPDPGGKNVFRGPLGFGL